MRVGLLLCDHLDPDAAAVAGDYPELYAAALGPHGIELEVFDLTAGRFPASTSDCQAWLTSGSRLSAYTDEGFIPDLVELLGRLADEERPNAGICFGHQVTARALGGTVARSEAGWGVGARTFDVVAPAPWMEPAGHTMTILMSHQDQVTDLPADAELVATAGYCPVGGYRVGDHVFCVQGHPEFVAPLSAHLATRRRAVIGDDVVDAALASLAGPLDHPAISAWIAAFLTRRW